MDESTDGPILGIDEWELRDFRAGLRRRYSDEHILGELRGCAERLGRSPTMREFAADVKTGVHPQTVIERFGTWNRAKRAANLPPRRFATREDLLAQLRALGDELGRTPTGRDLDERRRSMPSRSTYWQTFGSLTAALREAGFDLPPPEERRERAIVQGARLARRIRHLPRFADWASARRDDARLLSEWQVYRLFGARRGGWTAFQFVVRRRLLEEGAEVAPDGRLRYSPRINARGRTKRRSRGK